jgi:hypothetical protein
VSADDWVEGYQRAVSRLLEEKGTFVDLRHYGRDEWFMDEPDPSDYEEPTYGWKDWRHTFPASEDGFGGDGCKTVSLDHASLRERSLSLFDNTFTDNKDEVGMEMRATCACGEYTDRWVRWVGTMSDALEIILKKGSEQ